MSRTPMSGSGEERKSRAVEGVSREQHTVGRTHVFFGGAWWTPRGAAVGARERLPVGQVDVHCRTCSAAALGGHLEVLQWAHANGCPWNEETCSWAAWGGHFEVLQWARANGAPWDADTCYWAAGGEHLEMLQWLRANGCPWNERTCKEAEDKHHRDVFLWAHAKGCTMSDRTRLLAIRKEWLAQEAIPRLLDPLVVTHILRSEYFDDPADLARLPAVSRAMRDAVAATGLRFKELDEKRAVELGCLSAVQRLQRGGRLSRQELLCEAAARGGHLEELKVMRANGCPWDECTCRGAAEGGHLEVLQWARANGCPWDERTCRWAAEGGHLEVLQWAHANGCPWGSETCVFAAMGGHLEVLQWARANDCPWNERTCMGAAEGGHLEVLQWAQRERLPVGRGGAVHRRR